MALTATMLAQLSGTLTKGVSGALGSAAAEYPMRAAIQFADGAGLGQANKIWSSLARVLGPSATESHDLSDALVNSVGDPVVFTKIKGLFVAASALNANNVVVGGDAAAVLLFGASTHTQAVKPGGVLLIVAPDAAGFPVTATTADMLKILNGGAGTSVTYDIAIIGA